MFNKTTETMTKELRRNIGENHHQIEIVKRQISRKIIKNTFQIKSLITEIKISLEGAQHQAKPYRRKKQFITGEL